MIPRSNTLKTLALLCALPIAACGTQDEQGPVAEEIEDIGQDFGREGGDVFQETGEALEAMGDAITNRDRQTFSDKADEAVDDFDRWIDEQTDGLGELRADVRAEREQALRRARADLNAIERDLENLGDSAENEWDEASAEIRDAMNRLRDELQID